MMHIYESAEDYLEAILMLQEKNGHVRSIDVANMLNFSKPSVSIAMKKLRENGYVETDANGLLTLTPEGLEIAARVYERHRVLSDLLMALGVSAETARADACPGSPGQLRARRARYPMKENRAAEANTLQPCFAAKSPAFRQQRIPLAFFGKRAIIISVICRK